MNEDWCPEELPWNRRQRRTISKARGIVVNLCSGGNEGRWARLGDDKIRGSQHRDRECGHSQLGSNALDPNVVGWLRSLLRTGKVIEWWSGPPCRTVSVARSRAADPGGGDGGPPPLRAREGEERFGLPGITGPQQELADHDAALWILNLWLLRKAKMANEHLRYVIEQPQEDPERWMSRDHLQDRYPSFMVWPETVEAGKSLQGKFIHFNQGVLGHPTAKPTTLLTNIKRLMQLQGQCGSAKATTWPETLEKRLSKTKSMAEWAPGLVDLLIADAIEAARAEHEASVKALSAAEKQAAAAWRSHFAHGHVPYRRIAAYAWNRWVGIDHESLRHTQRHSAAPWIWRDPLIRALINWWMEPGIL